MSEENKKMVRNALDALGRGDLDGFLADATDDFEFVLGGSPPGGNTLKGKQDLLDLLKGMFSSKLVNSAVEMTIDNILADGDVVMEQARGKAQTLDGRDYNNMYCRVWRFRGGKICGLTEYMDTELARSCLWT